MSNEIKKVVIVGGGFAGIATAKKLAKMAGPNMRITLLCDRPHFEYHAALYRTVTGRSPLEVCIPLREIFKGKRVEVLEDSVISIDKQAKIVQGSSGSRYQYDVLVLTLGSITNYFGIEGLDKYSFGMKTVGEAIALKRHISETLLTCKIDFNNKLEQICDAHFVIIGAGASGVELAAEIVVYAKKHAQELGVDPSLVTVDLVEAGPKILPLLPATFTNRIEHHLRGLGVNIFLNRSIEKEEFESVYMRDVEMKARTVVWTAGVQANPLYKEMGLTVDRRGRAEVDSSLRAIGEESIFIGGDGASTPKSGMAQTALEHGNYIATTILRIERKQKVNPIQESQPIYAIPSGPSWAGILIGNYTIYGYKGWLVRRLLDLIIFLQILPFQKAIGVFRTDQSICDSCSICSVRE